MIISTKESPQASFVSPKQLASGLGVGRSTVQRWIDQGWIEACRTVGGHRRVAVADALRFIRDQGFTIRDPAALKLDAVGFQKDAGGENVVTRFSAALDAGLADVCSGLLIAAYLDGASVEGLCDGVIAPAMRRYGEGDIADARTIFIEHRGSEIVLKALHSLRQLMPAPPHNAPVAIGGAFPKDVSTLPTAMVAATLASRGWVATNLGPNTPLEAIAVAAIQEGARLAWVSVSRHDLKDAEAFARELQPFSRELADAGIRLAVGGRGIPAGWRNRQAHVTQMQTLRELTLFAEGLRYSPEFAANRVRSGLLTPARALVDRG